MLFMASVVLANSSSAECHCGDVLYPGCHYAECRYAECHGAKNCARKLNEIQQKKLDRRLYFVAMPMVQRSIIATLSITTVSIMTLSITTFSIGRMTAKLHGV
jgi:hypothetical protein